MDNLQMPGSWHDSFPKLLEEVHRDYFMLIVYQARDIIKDPVKAEKIAEKKFLTIYQMCERGALFFDKKETAMWYWLKSVRMEAIKRKSKFRIVSLRPEHTQHQSAEDARILALIDSHTEFKREMRELLEGLPEPDLSILRSYIFHGMSFTEIAGQVGLSYEATKKRYQRTLKSLEEKLSKLPGKRARLKDYLPVLMALLANLPEQ